MIPIRISFPGQNANAIAATQSITATAGGGVILNGSIAPRSNLTPSASTAASNPSNLPVVMAGLARTVTIFASASATNCIFTVIGQDLRGNTITATVVGGVGGNTPTTGAAVATTNGVDFHIVQGVVSSASVGNFTVGFGATGNTNWCKSSLAANPQMISIGGVVGVTGQTFTVEMTYDDVQTSTAPSTVTTGPVTGAVLTTFAGLTATTAPVAAVRGSVSTNLATSTLTFVFNQSGY